MEPVILAVYIVLLVVGGLMGYLKAGSKVSLFSSAGFAIALAIFGFAPVRYGATIVLALLVALLAVFTVRLVKTRKAMPAGVMVALTSATLLLLWLSGRA